MTGEFLAHGFLLALSIGTTLGVASIARRFRGMPGAGSLFLLMLSVTEWSGFYAIGTLFAAPGSRLLFERLSWFGIAFTPVFLLLFSLEYTGHGRLVTGRTRAALSAFPVAVLLAVWTNPLHGLMWPKYRLVQEGGLTFFFQTEIGILFFGFAFYAYALIGAGSLLVARTGLSGEMFRGQSLLLAAGELSILVVSAQSIFGLPMFPKGTDLTPYALTLTGAAFGAAAYRHRLFERHPAPLEMGRGAVLDGMEDAALIVGGNGEVLYGNTSAKDILGGSLLGRDVGELGVPLPEAGGGEVEVGGRTYDAVYSEVGGNGLGQSLVLRDVTERKARESELQRRGDELEELEEVNRVIRGVNKELAEASTRGEVGETVCRVLASSGLYSYACIEGGNGSDGEKGCGGEGLYSHGDPVEDGVGEWFSVPVGHGGVTHWYLHLWTERDEGMEGGEREVLEELGEVVGKTLTFLDRSRLLTSRERLKMEFGFESGPLAEELSGNGSRISADGVIPSAEGVLTFLSTETGGEAVRRLEGRDEVAHLREREEGDFELRIEEDSPLAGIVERGGRVVSLDVDDSVLSVEAEFPRGTDVPSLVEALESEFPGTRLLSKRVVEGGAEGFDEEEFDLTEKQRNALDATLRAGYFDWPRGSTAEEVAESMGVTSPTLHKHLRSAQKKVFERLLDRL